mgnify:CR=1 FL=1
MKKRTTMAFYVEALLLVLALLAVVLILTQCFAAAERTRENARQLTEAVHLVRNAAEAAAGADSPETLARLLADDAGNATDSGLQISYNESMEPDPAGAMSLQISWDKRPEPGGGLVTYTIWVTTRENEELYRLETAVYLGREKP